MLQVLSPVLGDGAVNLSDKLKIINYYNVHIIFPEPEENNHFSEF